MKSSSWKRGPRKRVKSKPKKRSAVNVRVLKLKEQIARSVPRIEHEAIIASLQLRITDLETRLRESRSEADALNAKLARFESLLGQVVLVPETKQTSL